MPPTSETIRAAQVGDETARREVLEYLYRLVHRQLAYSLGFGPALEDLVQDCILELYRALPRFQFRSSLSTWALRIALRTGRRRAGRYRIEHVELKPESILYSGDTAALYDLGRALQELEPKKREAFTLMEITGMTAEEAGEVLGVSPNTAASRCRHARSELDVILTRR